MSCVAQFGAAWTDAGLRPQGIEFPDLHTYVMQNGVAVLSGAFERAQLDDLKDEVHRWGKTQPLHPPQTSLDENYHAIESGISPRQKTPHNYHVYNFNQIRAVTPRELSDKLLAVFEPLRAFHNLLTGATTAFVKNADGRKVYPQVSCYPCGGGVFGRHIHALEPQRVGLVLAMSKRGRDFMHGGTHFEIDGRDVGTDEIHDIGDVVLFRYDIYHWVTPIDPEDALDYASPRGRWVGVLPFY
jgi:hypothetical protein